jgi:hypothetical protein
MFLEEGIPMKHRISFVWIAALAALLLPRPAFAAFHVMEVEQVIGGVNGDATAQAVQLRLRIAGQNFVSPNARLVVRDAAGANPVTLVTFGLPNPVNGAACARILSTTTAFNGKTTPVTVPDYTMAAIPPAYLAAGSLTFEGVSGSIVYWRVTWGGAGYTGTQPVDPTNFGGGTSSGPAFGAALPSGGPQALHFTPACGTTGTNTAAQYALTTGTAVFTNNAATSFTVNVPPIPALPGDGKLLLPAALGLAVLGFAILRRRRA